MSGKGKRRLDKVQLALTPTQIAVQLLQELHQSPSLVDYVASLAGKSVVFYPLDRAARRAVEAVRAACAGQDRETRYKAERQAWKDAVFLLRLLHQADCRALEKEEPFRLSYGWLLDGLKSLLTFTHAEDARLRLWRETCAGWPYPQDLDTAAAVAAARQHQVQPWTELEESGTVRDWVVESFVQQGRTRLPFGAYLAREQDAGTGGRWLKLPTPTQVRACFPDEHSYAQFLAGEGFSYGLADVPDDVAEAQINAVEAAFYELVAGGTTQAGAVLRLPQVPVPFLQDAPLVDGVWLDRTTLALAALGALLARHGYAVSLPDDDHVFASSRVIHADGAPIDADTWVTLRQQAEAHLQRFPGRTRVLDGRPYVHSQDYGAWKGRLLRGPLPQAESGVVVASWNAWVDAHGGPGAAALAGVPVERLWVYGEEAQMLASDVVTARSQQQARETVLAGLRVPATPAAERLEQARDWQERATWFLADLHSQQLAVDQLSERYFQGQPVLFPQEQHRLRGLLSGTEDLVALFNEAIAAPLDCTLAEGEPSMAVDAAAVKASRGAQASLIAGFLVDFARSKTLDDMGENQAAHALMEKHLSDHDANA